MKRADLFNPQAGLILYNREPWRITFFILWYDCWIGFYYDTDDAILYLNLFPCCVLKIQQVAQDEADEE